MIVCVGTGPSLSREQCAAIPEAARIIAVNNAWAWVRRADVLYAGDFGWWRFYLPLIRDQNFAGERWSANREAGRFFGVTTCPRYATGSGLPREEGIYQGCDSGFQALQLAIWWGAAAVHLLGYDYRKEKCGAHCHADHPAPLLNGTDYARRIQPYEQLAKLGPRPPIYNCSERSALRCFHFRPISSSSATSAGPASSSARAIA